MSEEILAISTARNNGELIAQCHQLGYLENRPTLDPTYGLGRFWTVWRPDVLVGCDLNPERSPIGRSVDFTRLHQEVWQYPQIVFDPPYKLNGTSTGRGPSSSDDAYGVAGEYLSARGKHELIAQGISSCAQVLEPGGVLLLKCQDQVNGGRVRWQTMEFTLHAAQHNLELVDMLHLVGGRKQPEGRGQQHARRNYSTLLVFRAPR